MTGDFGILDWMRIVAPICFHTNCGMIDNCQEPFFPEDIPLGEVTNIFCRPIVRQIVDFSYEYRFVWNQCNDTIYSFCRCGHKINALLVNVLILT